MPVFSASAIAQLRALNRGSLTSRATIARAVLAASTGGGANTGARTWTPLDDGEDVACRVTDLSGSGVLVPQAGQPFAPDRVLVVFDLLAPDMQEGDRITVTGTDDAGNDWTRVVLVLALRGPRTYSAMRVVVCQDAGPGST